MREGIRDRKKKLLEGERGEKGEVGKERKGEEGERGSVMQS